MVKRGLILGGILALVSGVFVSSCYAATSGTTKFSVDVDDTVLELTVPASPAVIDLNPTITGASFGSTTVTVKVATNNITGYQLTMTPTNSQTNTSLIRTETIGTEQTYREIETLDLTDPVSTGYPEADFTANRWGYKITGDNYYGIDPNNTTVSHLSWTTSEPTNGTNHNLTLAAKVDASTVSGAYETTLNFRAVTNAVVAKDTVTFNGNGADSGSMDDAFVLVSGESTTLPTNTFTKSGYAFLGWNTAQNGSGMSYADGGTYTAVSTDYSHDITLYAMWMDTSSGIYNKLHPGGSGLSGGITISRAYEIAYTNAGKGMWERDEEDRDNDGDTSEYYQVEDGIYHNYDVRWDMQGMTPEICGSVTEMHDDYQMMDIRDWKLYHITKLRDGNCWMTQNLDFDIPAAGIDSTTSDLSVFGGRAYTNGYSQQSINNGTIIHWTPTRGTTATLSQWESSYYTPYSFDPGNWFWNNEHSGESIYIYPNPLTHNYFSREESDIFATTSFVSTAEHGHVGNYYNFPAAHASNDYERDSNTAYTYIAENSICPKGWRLPTYSTMPNSTTGKNGEYKMLYLLYGDLDQGWFSAPFYFTLTGSLNIGNGYKYVDATNESGYYWDERGSLGIYNNGSSFNSDVGRWNGYGISVRCIAR